MSYSIHGGKKLGAGEERIRAYPPSRRSKFAPWTMIQEPDSHVGNLEWLYAVIVFE